jgi:hypothetical protein
MYVILLNTTVTSQWPKKETYLQVHMSDTAQSHELPPLNGENSPPRPWDMAVMTCWLIFTVGKWRPQKHCKMVIWPFSHCLYGLIPSKTTFLHFLPLQSVHQKMSYGQMTFESLRASIFFKCHCDVTMTHANGILMWQNIINDQNRPSMHFESQNMAQQKPRYCNDCFDQYKKK